MNHTLCEMRVTTLSDVETTTTIVAFCIRILSSVPTRDRETDQLDARRRDVHHPPLSIGIQHHRPHLGCLQGHGARHAEPRRLVQPRREHDSVDGAVAECRGELVHCAHMGGHALHPPTMQHHV